MVVGSPIVLNLIPGGVMPVIMINETDKGYQKEFLIYNGNTPYNAPANVSATIRGTKRDGLGVTEAATVTAGSNVVRITVTEQMTAVPGKNIFELVFVDTNGLRVATANFIMLVERSALNANTVISESDIAYSEQVLNQLGSVAAFKNQLDNLQNTRPYVVPEMYGAVGDGVTDDYQAFVSALNSGKQVMLSAKTYRLSGSIYMPQETSICGSDRYKSVLRFDSGVNGIGINRKTMLKNCTLYIEGNAKAVYSETKLNANYNMGTYVGNIDILNLESNATGTGIELTAETSTTGQEGMYNILFDDVVMRGAFKYGIKLTNRVKTTSENETWITGVTFRDVFIQAAETAIESSWTDISGTNIAPITGQASKNGDVKFIRVDAQYTNGITKCFARIYNAINAVFDHCTTFDYWHLRYDLHLPFYELNATSGMCTVEINGNSEITGTTLYDISQYIGCINGNISTAFHDIIKSIYTSATRTSEKEFIDPYTEESTDIIPATGMSPTVSLYKRGGVVQLMINVLIDTQAEAPHNYVNICTLPSGYRPKYNIFKSTFSTNYPYIFIGIDGIVKIWVNVQNLERFYISESFVAMEN